MSEYPFDVKQKIPNTHAQLERNDIKKKTYNYIDGLAEWLKRWNPPGL